jgi:hypothetical protein
MHMENYYEAICRLARETANEKRGREIEVRLFLFCAERLTSSTP